VKSRGKGENQRERERENRKREKKKKKICFVLFSMSLRFMTYIKSYTPGIGAPSLNVNIPSETLMLRGT